MFPPQVVFDTVVTYYELTFENQGYVKKMEAQAKRKADADQPIKASVIFEMFPFCILYNVSSVSIMCRIKVCPSRKTWRSPFWEVLCVKFFPQLLAKV